MKRRSLLRMLGVFAVPAILSPGLVGAAEGPDISIRQYPDYPLVGRGSIFPGGLVVALWREGRIIQPAAPNAIGGAYIEGTVDPADSQEFFQFLDQSAAIRLSPSQMAPLHRATQSIRVRKDKNIIEWIRVLPDTDTPWVEIQSRVLGLKVQNIHPVEWSVVEKSQWYK